MLPTSLHPLEKKFLKALLGYKELKLEEVSKAAGLDIDQARRVTEWLRVKGIIQVKEFKKKYYLLGKEGEKALEKGLPERRLLRAIKDRVKVDEIRKKLNMDEKEFDAALGRALRRGWTYIDKEGCLRPKEVPTRIPEEDLLRKLASGPVEESTLSNEELVLLQEVRKRPNYIESYEKGEVYLWIEPRWREEVEKLPLEEEIVQLKPEHLIDDVWRSLKFSKIDVSAPTPSIYPARRHPLNEFIKVVREIFVSLGFEEVRGPIIQSAFWNFDALFTPQDHPAREMQDTFYIKDLRGNLPDQDLVKNVRQVHEDGRIAGSRGWRYKWSEDKARKIVLRTHTTAVTIRTLHELKDRDARIFSIGRVYRNENIDSKHLAEFYQVEGIAVGKKMNLRHLMGYLTLFYKKLGFEKVKFWPTFFPYTEPSLQSMVYSEKLGKWLELCGMGIFRPEVVRPLGVTKPVLAWGMGLERLAMLYYDVTDIRQFYTNNLSWLRSVKCR